MAVLGGGAFSYERGAHVVGLTEASAASWLAHAILPNDASPSNGAGLALSPIILGQLFLFVRCQRILLHKCCNITSNKSNSLPANKRTIAFPG